MNYGTTKARLWNPRDPRDRIFLYIIFEEVFKAMIHGKYLTSQNYSLTQDDKCHAFSI
jgi:hypothetical protein